MGSLSTHMSVRLATPQPVARRFAPMMVADRRNYRSHWCGARYRYER